MGVTIKEIAAISGVSIATVSHVINKTRYVSPELVNRVEQVMEMTGYSAKIADKENNLLVGKQSAIALVIPNIGSTVYSQLASALSRRLTRDGYLLAVHLTNDDFKHERHVLDALTANKRYAGILLAPVCDDPAKYTKFFRSNLPFVCIERTIKRDDIDSVLSENVNAIYSGTRHLIKSGHENIVLLVEKRELSTVSERITGFKNALSDNNIEFREDMLLQLDLYERDEVCEQAVIDAYDRIQPTAFIAGGNKLTLILLRALQSLGKDCPKDVSVVGFGDEEWCELVSPPLTTIKQNTEEMALIAAEKILNKLKNPAAGATVNRVPVQLEIRKSTQMIGRGPFGEKAVSPEKLALTAEERARLRDGGFKVGISFHYSGTAWTHLHEDAIRSTLESLGVSVISVADAHFDPELQVTQLEAISMQKPDAVIAIPVDDKITSPKFREISKTCKMIFISNVPEGIGNDEYATCVSVNERENGANGALLIGDYYKDEKSAVIGMITHGTPFYGTHLRDMVAEQAIREGFANIKIAAVEPFYAIENSYGICQKMIAAHPEIQGLYVSWERPALEVIRALKDMGREDISIFTFDLDYAIASYMAKGEFVRGLVSQRPFEQGEAVALATAKALLCDEPYKYVGVPPYTIRPKNLLKAWKDIAHEPIPESIEKDISQYLRK